MINRQNVVQRELTPEQLEYEELNKRMRITTAKLRIAQEGVDISSISQQKLDIVMRIFEEMDQIQRDTQQKTSNVQQKANADIQKVNQDAGKKFGDVQKKYQNIIDSLKTVQFQIGEQVEGQPVIQIEPVKEETAPQEEVREKTHEEKVSEITDEVLKAMRDSVSQKIDEILKAVDSKAEFTIGKGVNTSKEVVDETAKQMAVESTILSTDKPDDKDIPVISPEMIQKTQDEIERRKKQEGEIKHA